MRGLLARVGIVGLFIGGGLIARPFLMGNAGDLKVGECFDEPGIVQEVEDVQHHPCTDPHTGEVVFVGTMSFADGASYPTTEGFDQEILRLCVPAFDAYTGLDFQTDPTWTLGYFIPLERDWSTGDRSLICYAAPFDSVARSGSLKVD